MKAVPTQFVIGTLMAPLAAALVYLHGLWVGHFLDLRGVSEYCSAKPLAYPATSWGYLPLRHLCRYDDGTTEDLVPGYVNPIIVLCLAFGMACTVLTLRSARSFRRGDPTALEFS